MYNKKETQKTWNGITRCESLSMRPIKQSVYKWGNELVPHTLQILKCMPVSFLQIVHIKLNGTKFLIPEECFPNQLHHPNKRSTTLSGKTRDTKRSQSKTPQLVRNLAVNQQVIHCLSTTPTHTTSLHYSKASSP